MEIDFSDLLKEDDQSPIHPREVFLTLERDSSFSFLRDVQADVLDQWFDVRTNKDTVVKLNVGSGKTVVGLLVLQSSINEGVGPSVFVSPDNLLVEQTVAEARRLGIDITTDETDGAFRRGERILAVNIHKLFNGRSVFGVGSAGNKIPIGTLIIDDVHACISAISEQFRITLPNTHPAYAWALSEFEDHLRQQSLSTFLSLKGSEPGYYMEVPFWAYQSKADELLGVLHSHRTNDELKFSYPFLSDVLRHCRLVIGSRELLIEPPCPTTDMVNAFREAKRRVYMTATLSDDSVLTTHFGAEASQLGKPITAASAQALGERMIIMPQELNQKTTLADLQQFLADLSTKYNVVVITPSQKAAEQWKQVATEILVGDQVANGVARLRRGHVGLVVLVNRYDGIDLPQDACRVLCIADLPEANNLIERVDAPVLGDSTVGLKRHIQRIEQGMGRGIRAADDYCVVLLFGSRLTQRLLSEDGSAMLTTGTRAQLDLSRQLARKLQGAKISDLRQVLDACLTRERNWTQASKRALLKASPDTALHIEDHHVAVKTAFEETRIGEHRKAADILNKATNSASEKGLKAWLKVRLAEVTNLFDPSEAQRIQQAAYRLHRGVLRPIEGVAYEKLRPADSAQAIAVQAYLRKFLEGPERILFARQLVEVLCFDQDTAHKFEQALMDAGQLLGIMSQRPEAETGEGPDNLWALRSGQFLIIECKNGSTSQQGISKADLGQLDQSMTWFEKRYPQVGSVVPVIIHPLSKVGPHGVLPNGLRIMTPKKLEEFKAAVVEFVTSVSPADRLGNEKTVREALSAHGLSEDKLLAKFTVPPG